MKRNKTALVFGITLAIAAALGACGNKKPMEMTLEESSVIEPASDGDNGDAAGPWRRGRRTNCERHRLQREQSKYSTARQRRRYFVTDRVRTAIRSAR